MPKNNTTVVFGYCHCGCGQRTNLMSQSCPRRGYVKGQPHLFLIGHGKRKLGPSYVAEDRGFVGGPCWVWQRYINEDGYGQMFANGMMRGAHIVFYERAYGPVPEGFQIDHLCKVRCCVNPDHMEPVTHTVNMQRSILAKLTPDGVRRIREIYAVGGRSQQSIADEYGVTQAIISKVVRRDTWKNID